MASRKEGKTFVLLDMALAIANGQYWHGYKVPKNNIVVYVVPESSSSFKVRVPAWAANAKKDVSETGFLMVPNDVQLHVQDEVRDFIDALKAHLRKAQDDIPEAQRAKVGLVVFDTFARCFEGKDENGVQDTGLAVRGMEAIRTAFPGATIMLAHHTDKGGNDYRGSSNLRGAMTTMIFAKGVHKGPALDAITLMCTKQKDAPHFADLRLSMVASGKSLAVRGVSGQKPSASAAGKPRAVRYETLGILAGLAEGVVLKPVPSAEIIREAMAQLNKIDSTIRKQLRTLVETDGFVSHDKAAATYALTDKGLKALDKDAKPVSRHVPERGPGESDVA